MPDIGPFAQMCSAYSDTFITGAFQHGCQKA